MVGRADVQDRRNAGLPVSRAESRRSCHAGERRVLVCRHALRNADRRTGVCGPRRAESVSGDPQCPAGPLRRRGARADCRDLARSVDAGGGGAGDDGADGGGVGGGREIVTMAVRRGSGEGGIALRTAVCRTPRAEPLGLRAEVERTGAENASTRIHLGTSSRAASNGASTSCKQERACPWRRSSCTPPSPTRASSPATSSGSSASHLGSSERSRNRLNGASPNRRRNSVPEFLVNETA